MPRSKSTALPPKDKKVDVSDFYKYLFPKEPFFRYRIINPTVDSSAYSTSKQLAKTDYRKPFLGK